MKIAIQGHPTRGKEVIQIFKDLGTKDLMDHTGLHIDWVYMRDDSLRPNQLIVGTDIAFLKGYGYRIYTLEEFEKEFPFKIGDKVKDCSDDEIGTILGFIDIDGELMYVVNFEKSGHANMPVEELKPYKEMKEERNITLTLEKAKEWYNKGGELKEIALQAFSEKELNPLPRSWEEFCENYPIQDHEAFINYVNCTITVCKECAGSGLGIWRRKPEKDRCKCVSQKSAVAHLAMIQLEQLRDCWRQGWKPKEHESVYTIKFSVQGLRVYNFNSREFYLFQLGKGQKNFLNVLEI